MVSTWFFVNKSDSTTVYAMLDPYLFLNSIVNLDIYNLSHSVVHPLRLTIRASYTN